MWWHPDNFSDLQSGGSAFISMIFGDRSKFLALASSPQSIPADIGRKIALAFVPKANSNKDANKKEEPEMLSKVVSGEKRSVVNDDDAKEKSGASWYQKLKNLLAAASNRFLSTMNRG